MSELRRMIVEEMSTHQVSFLLGAVSTIITRGLYYYYYFSIKWTKIMYSQFDSQSDTLINK
jgi:hypothetical protein